MIHSILNLFFDRTCACCHRRNSTSSILCLDCQPPSFNTTAWSLHLSCGDSITAYSAWSYSGAAANLIKAMKSQPGTRLALLMADTLAEFLRETDINLAGTLIIPAPITKSSLHLRGYNQSLILAKQISRKFGAPLKNAVFASASSYQGTQKMLSRERRLQNRCYQLRRKLPKDISSITLVDDVITTGATMAAMVTAVRKDYSIRVQAVSLARVN